LLCAAPLLALLVAWGIGVVFDRLRWGAWRGELLRRWGRSRSLSIALLTLLSTVGAAQWQGGNHALARVKRYETQLQAAFDSGIPILSKDKPHNAATAAANVYLTQEQLRRSKLIVSKRKGTQLRVLIDRKNPQYRGLSKRQLKRAMLGILSRPHVEVSTGQRAFGVHLR
jgi:hypothetical protein